MMGITGVAFQRARAERLLCDPWQLVTDGVMMPMPETVPHWDYSLNLVLERTLVLDLSGVREDCGLGDGIPLRVAAVWRSSGTALRGCLDRADLSAGGGIHTVRLQGEIPGRELSGSVQLETQLVLPTARSGADVLSPSLAGSVLWRDTAAFAVEGKASRFPVEIVDFQKVLWAPGEAGWYLSWNSHDLHQPFLGGVELFVNARHKVVVNAVSGSTPGPEAKAIRATIYYDVARALLRGALRNEEFLENPDRFSEGTVGRAVGRLMRLLFPGDAAPAIRNTMDERPEYFDSTLQASLQVFWA